MSRRLRAVVRRLMWVSGLIGLGLAALWMWVTAEPFPVHILEQTSVESRRLMDRQGTLLRWALSDLEGRGTWRDLEEISPWVPAAFMAIEDHRFHAHPGVDLRGIARALWANLRAGRVVAGGSTLTQQLIQQIQPQPRTVWGKLREAIWALRLERVLTKEEILEAYVNRVPFGNGAHGIEAAARLYLDRSARGLSLAEAAFLAGIPRAPSLNNPFSNGKRARRRQRIVLGRMAELGTITERERAGAWSDPVELTSPQRTLRAPHFTTFVLGQRPPPGEIHTTLDSALQLEVERLVRETLKVLEDRNARQAAVVVLDNATGDILAWVGSGDFFDATEGQVDMVIRRRQPGSTLKPFVYGLAIEEGWTAATRLPDLPIFFPALSGDYRPRNYDRRFHGWVRLRAALANSYNVPAVWLAFQLGVPSVHARLRALGFASLWRQADYYGLGLALGNGEVELLELANAYRAVANDGVWQPVRWNRRAAIELGRRVMPASVARLLTDILADPVARAPAFGRDNPLELPFPTAAKTGTSRDFTDNWTVGFSASLTVGVWVGNFDGRPMERLSGLTGAAPLWHRVMRAAVEIRAPAGSTGTVAMDRPFSRRGLREVLLCDETGRRFHDDCPHSLVEWYVPGTEPPLEPQALAQPPDKPGAHHPEILFPDDGDIFSRSADVPASLARLRLQARMPASVQSIVWEIDGIATRPQPRPFTRWWALRLGDHVIRARSTDEPRVASAPIRFHVVE